MILASLPVLTDPAIVAFADVIRALCSAGAALLVGLALALSLRLSGSAVRLHRDGEAAALDRNLPANEIVWLLVGFSLLAVSVLGTEVERIGAPVTWRLVFNCAGVLIGLLAVGRLLRRARLRNGASGA